MGCAAVIEGAWVGEGKRKRGGPAAVALAQDGDWPRVLAGTTASERAYVKGVAAALDVATGRLLRAAVARLAARGEGLPDPPAGGEPKSAPITGPVPGSDYRALATLLAGQRSLSSLLRAEVLDLARQLDAGRLSADDVEAMTSYKGAADDME